MMHHLRPEEFVEALEGTIEPGSRAHLKACGECRQELAQLQSIVGDVRGVGAPEPSPLFWDHFSARVRQATMTKPTPSGAAWWRGWWRPIGAVATAVGAVVVMFALRPLAPAPPSGTSVESAPVLEAMADDGSWGLVVGLASGLKWADVQAVAEPAAGTADAMIDELTTAQREAFVRLLQKEMGDQ